MLIHNYDNRNLDISEKLKAQGKSDWFIAGAFQGAHGLEPAGPRPPKPPLLNVKELPGNRLEVSGDTYPHREIFKRHGGWWQADNRSWIISKSRLEALLNDSELESATELLIGRDGLTGDVLALARADFSAGYVYGQQHAMHAPIGKISFSRRHR